MSNQVNVWVNRSRTCRSDCEFDFFMMRLLVNVETSVCADREEAALLMKTLGCETTECDKVTVLPFK